MRGESASPAGTDIWSQFESRLVPAADPLLHHYVIILTEASGFKQRFDGTAVRFMSCKEINTISRVCFPNSSGAGACWGRAGPRCCNSLRSMKHQALSKSVRTLLGMGDKNWEGEGQKRRAGTKPALEHQHKAMKECRGIYLESENPT